MRKRNKDKFPWWSIVVIVLVLGSLVNSCGGDKKNDSDVEEKPSASVVEEEPEKLPEKTEDPEEEYVYLPMTVEDEEEPAEEPPEVEEKPAEEPSVEETPIVEEPVVEEPELEDPFAGMDDPELEDPFAGMDDPVIEGPSYDESVEDEPVYEEPVWITYVKNINSYIFHYDWCPSVDRMSEKNKQFYTGTRDEVIAQGFEPCQNCNP